MIAATLLATVLVAPAVAARTCPADVDLPEAQQVYLCEALPAFERGRFVKARLECERALVLDPTLSEAAYIRALSLLRTLETSAGVEALEALAEDPIVGEAARERLARREVRRHRDSVWLGVGGDPMGGLVQVWFPLPGPLGLSLERALSDQAGLFMFDWYDDALDEDALNSVRISPMGARVHLGFTRGFGSLDLSLGPSFSRAHIRNMAWEAEDDTLRHDWVWGFRSSLGVDYRVHRYAGVRAELGAVGLGNHSGQAWAVHPDARLVLQIFLR